jgi:hypothetical protein
VNKLPTPPVMLVKVTKLWAASIVMNCVLVAVPFSSNWMSENINAAAPVVVGEQEVERIGVADRSCRKVDGSAALTKRTLKRRQAAGEVVQLVDHDVGVGGECCVTPGGKEHVGEAYLGHE